MVEVLNLIPNLTFIRNGARISNESPKFKTVFGGTAALRRD